MLTVKQSTKAIIIDGCEQLEKVQDKLLWNECHMRVQHECVLYL